VVRQAARTGLSKMNMPGRLQQNTRRVRAGKAIIAYVENYIPISGKMQSYAVCPGVGCRPVRHGSFTGGRKSIRDLPQEFRCVERGLWGVRRHHGIAAVDLSFRVHFHLRRLLLRRPGRRAFRAGGKPGERAKKGELNHEDKNSFPGTIKTIPTSFMELFLRKLKIEGYPWQFSLDWRKPGPGPRGVPISVLSFGPSARSFWCSPR
jgi:hypothetical protein